MNRDEARKMALGAGALLAYWEGDFDRVSVLLGELGAQFPELADGFTYVSIAAATMCKELAVATSIGDVFSLIERDDVRLVPDADVDWGFATLLALGASTGDEEQIAAAVAGVDVPTAVNSALSLASATIKRLAEATGRDAPSFARSFAGVARTALAGGAPGVIAD